MIKESGFSLKHVRAVLYHPWCAYISFDVISFNFKKTQFYFDYHAGLKELGITLGVLLLLIHKAGVPYTLVKLAITYYCVKKKKMAKMATQSGD